MAARTLKTLVGTIVSRSGNEKKCNVIASSSTLFARNSKVLRNYQLTAAYRAAVLHEIAKPLVIEDISSVGKLKDSEVQY